MISNDIVQSIAGMMDTILDAKFDKYLADMVTKTDLDEVLDECLADMVTKADLDEVLDERLADMVTKADLDEVLDERLADMVTKTDLDERLADMVTKTDLDERLADMVTKTDLDERLADVVTKKELEETRRSIENGLLYQTDIVQEKSNEHFAELKADIDTLKHGFYTITCGNNTDCLLAEEVEKHDKRICVLEKRIS